ncbi:hypothetical protein IRJ41_009167 [Triplophysa rosa]|uniref:Core-binding (CB) domain-containing protein n=1 Tax=Triplophysa rosa TaxID=992332 RepID=A0A9W7TC94_TRIRA|nr:hypothetical protein IRJ41_009167 [Triplophysa rosa]
MAACCPLCLNMYAQLSQHLRVTHKVLNVLERKLILSLESGRVQYRERTCIVPGCEVTTSRLDRHIQTHTELSKGAQRDVVRDCKRKKVLEALAALRATCPAVPMATSLDIITGMMRERGSWKKRKRITYELIEEYRQHHEGSEPSAKLKNNVSSKVFRIKHFLGYMAEVQSNLASLLFINDTKKIRSWLTKLRQAKITETTIHHYLKNLAQFLDYISETPPATCRLSKIELVTLRREVRMLIKGLRRKVVTHEFAVKTAKEAKNISKSCLLKCRVTAKKAIPDILARLKESGDQKDQRSFYGHLTAYLSTIYGHRGGVFQNMLVEEVEGASKSSSTNIYLINVNRNTQVKPSFWGSPAVVDRRGIWLVYRIPKYDAKPCRREQFHILFFTSKPNVCKNLNAYFHDAWVSMGLEGSPNFTDMRSSIATHAKQTHTPEARHKISQFMCHDTATADRFYAVHLNAQQAAEHRVLFEAALEGPDVSPCKEESLEDLVSQIEPGSKRRASASKITPELTHSHTQTLFLFLSRRRPWRTARRSPRRSPPQKVGRNHRRPRLLYN